MIAIYKLDTAFYSMNADTYYSMLDVAENSVFTVSINNKIIRLKCVEQIDGQCANCYFKISNICPSKIGYNSCGIACSPEDRNDKKNCIFIEVKNKRNC